MHIVLGSSVRLSVHHAFETSHTCIFGTMTVCQDFFNFIYALQMKNKLLFFFQFLSDSSWWS